MNSFIHVYLCWRPLCVLLGGGHMLVLVYASRQCVRGARVLRVFTVVVFCAALAMVEVSTSVRTARSATGSRAPGEVCPQGLPGLDYPGLGHG